MFRWMIAAAGLFCLCMQISAQSAPPASDAAWREGGGSRLPIAAVSATNITALLLFY